VDKLVEQLGIKGISKSQVSKMSKVLDAQVQAFRDRALDAGPYAFVWMDALTQKVREGGPTVNVHVLIATGVNADGHRGILGVEVTSADASRAPDFFETVILSGAQMYVVAVIEYGSRRIRILARPRTRPLPGWCRPRR
jgi:transposase-like protein